MIFCAADAKIVPLSQGRGSTVNEISELPRIKDYVGRSSQICVPK
jgi:hypothetical protein